MQPDRAIYVSNAVLLLVFSAESERMLCQMIRKNLLFLLPPKHKRWSANTSVPLVEDDTRVNCDVLGLYGTLSNDTKVYVRQVCWRACQQVVYSLSRTTFKRLLKEKSGGIWGEALSSCGAQAASAQANDPVCTKTY